MKMTISYFRYIIYIYFLFFFYIHAFNVDTKAPIVKIGYNDSYFGYSLAFHWIKNEENGISEPVFLVGAPRDNITVNGAPSEVKSISRPGVVYQCPYNSETKCTPIKIDLEAPDIDDDRQDQWMGVSISSQGTDNGRAVACAHRFKKASSSFRWGLGICYSMTNSLDEDQAYQPCDGKRKDKGHEEYGFCQAGISSVISKDGDLVLGSPGPFTWRGAIFKNTVVRTLDSDNNWYNSPVEDPRRGSNMPEPAVRFYSYLGMQVKVGNLINGRKTYIAGAPRSEDVGQVLLFQTLNNNDISIEPRYKITGDQFGSYFGHDFAVGDFNLDGKEDLVVGAPFYRDAGICGAIYIYMNGPEGISASTKALKILSRKMKEAECVELDCLNARFGFSIANAGDLDHDGFEDLIVGAPFEGNGVIYVFQGSPTGIRKLPSQRIAASMFGPNIPKSFGSSLTGGSDVDQNGYPDIIVGAFASDKVFLLRTRPVINVQTQFHSYQDKIDPNVKQCPKDGQPYNCIEIRVCFRFQAEPANKLLQQTELVYRIEAEKFTGTIVSRVFFKGSVSKDENYLISKVIRLNKQSTSEYECNDQLVYIVNSNRDFLNPIAFQLTYKLNNAVDPEMRPGGPLPDMNKFPVLNDMITDNVLKVDFKKNCGNDDICESDLKLKGTLSLTSTGLNDYKLRVGLDDEISLTITVSNQEEDAHEAMLYVTLPPSLIYRGVDDKGKELSCDPSRASLIVCTVGNPLGSRSEVIFSIRLDTTNALPSFNKLNISLLVNTTSKELVPLDNEVVLLMDVTIETDLAIRGQSEPESVFFGGEIKGESAIRFEDQIGSEVKHSYEVKNIGRAQVPESTLFISWPYEQLNEYPSGKHLLYLIDEPKLDGDGECFIDRKMINPLNIVKRSDRQDKSPSDAMPSQSREKRSERRAIKRRNFIQSTNSLTLDCDSKTARCYTFNCTLRELKPGQSVVVRIRSRLWNSTFIEDYHDYDVINIFSMASVQINPRYHIKQSRSDNDVHKIVTRVTPEVQERMRIPLWIIIVSVLAGVLLLIILIILLWKCGFFRRQKHDQMVTHKAKKKKVPTATLR